MQEKIDLLEIAKALIKRWWILFICVVLLGGASYSYSKFVKTKMYASIGRMYIDTYRGTNDEGDGKSAVRDVQTINASQRSVLTCIEVLKSERVLKQVKDNGNLPYSTSALRRMLTMKSVNDTEVLEIRVDSSSAVNAKIIVDELMRVGEKELKEIVGVTTAKAIDAGTMTGVPISPNVYSEAVMGAVIGALIGALLVIGSAVLDNRVKSEEDLKGYDVPVIGVILKI